jgi:hypothetical protein
MDDHEDDWLYDAVESLGDRLDDVLRRLEAMAIDQTTFDTDLAALVQSITDLTTAVDSWVASHPDLSAEDQTVQTAAAAVSAELAKITPAPPAPPAPGA